MPADIMKTYSQGFYADLATTALPSARRIVPDLMELIAPRSVIDVGCGDGSWLSVFREHGVGEIRGIDGPWVDAAQLRIPPECFRRAELDKPLGIDGRFDLAMSLEVIEHLSPARGTTLVAELCGLAPVVLFSAAIPHQGGLHHVNEQWPRYWASLFVAHSYHAVDVLRLRYWNDPQVTWWYKQNLLLFARENIFRTRPALAAARAAAPQEPPSLVHPDRYLAAIRQSQPGFGRWLKGGAQALRRSLVARRKP